MVPVSLIVQSSCLLLPSHFDTKLNALTKWWDIYPKEKNIGYTTINPYNFKLIFTYKQLIVSVRAIILVTLSLYVAIVIDLDTLHQDIYTVLSSNSITAKHNFTESYWSMDSLCLLLLDYSIFIPSLGDLYIYVLQYNHDDILDSYFCQNKTLELICHEYFQPSLYVDVQ